MKKETILIASIALLVGVIGGYCVSVAKYELNDSRAYERYDEVRMYGDEDEWEGGMMGMMGSFPYGYDDDDAHRGHMMEMVVGSEKEFLTEMIPHHQEAVDTAKEVLARGATTPEIRVLVENIITAQEQEIAEMKEWYQGWYGEAYRDDGSYRPMMRELKGLSGGVLDRVFLSDMIMHHMGAIMMARSVQPYVEHDEMKTLTANIEETQSAEIVQMRAMLRSL